MSDQEPPSGGQQPPPPPPAQQPGQQPGQWAPPPPGAGYGQSAPGGGVYYSPEMGQGRSNGIATWSLVLGILSILGFWTFGVGVLLGILAVIFGIMGRNRAREIPGNPNEGRATAGLVTGVLGIIGGVIFIGWLLTFADDVVDEIEREFDDGVCEADNPFDPDC